MRYDLRPGLRRGPVFFHDMTNPETFNPALLTVEPLVRADLPQVLAIEQASFKQPWTREGFETELDRAPAISLTLKDGREIHGYLVFWLIADEMHILNIAVRPDLRKKGLGGILLEYLTAFAREVGVVRIFLEVRRSNVAAQALYRSAGFEFAGERKNYYAEDHEDALMMTLSL
ncbi:MAG: ribosomal protein S18-alanine N-acetyltransferase [Pseudomonadota bacterium]